MLRLLAAIAAETIAIVLCSSAFAASDVTIAAIATGRLYVFGTTERPNTPVLLDDQFRTESDDKGKFQYELVYHPARCIISAMIDGKAYEAVVSNCGEQCHINPPKKAPKSTAVSSSNKPDPVSNLPGTPASAELSKPAKSSEAALPTAVVPNTTSSVNKEARLPGNGPRRINAVTNPPLPPSRPAFRAETQAHAPRAIKTLQRPKPDLQQGPGDQGDLPED